MKHGYPLRGYWGKRPFFLKMTPTASRTTARETKSRETMNNGMLTFYLYICCGQEYDFLGT